MDSPRTSDATDVYFEPLGTKASLGRAVHVFRRRWKQLLFVSALPVCMWYAIAIGIRRALGGFSASHAERMSFEMGGETVTYPWESLRATCSRLGLVAEFLLSSFLCLPANATNIRTVALLYAGRDVEGIRTILRAVWPKLPSLGLVCVVSCTVLMLPLVLIVLCMAPEDETPRDGIAIYYRPWLPKLLFGVAYLIASSAFMLATYLSYSILTVRGGRAIATLKESCEFFKKSWQHIGAVAFLWFLVKIAITKCVSAINLWYYQHEKRFWLVWDQPGIPLHPIRILWSTSNDLWEFGRSWISVPFVIFLAAMGSVFQAVLYIDTRIKQEGYTRNLLCAELGLPGSEETNGYKTMEMNDVVSTSGGPIV